MGEPADWDALIQRARQLAAMFDGAPAVTEAELAASGIRPVSVTHGDPESEEDAELIHQAAPPGPRVRTPGRVPGRK